ncbi:MAG: hypothetical protein ABIR08_03545 [Sphingomonas sp.]
MSGRPIRFLGATALGWVAVRAFVLWPTAVPAAIPRALVPAAFADGAPPATGILPPRITDINATPWQPQTASVERLRPIVARMDATFAPNTSAVAIPSAGRAVAGAAAAPPQSVLAPPPAILATTSPSANRWSASAWLVLRDGRGIAAGLGGGQLGGSQAGLRLAYTVDKARRVAIVGRVATPLKGLGREAAIGVEWRPTALPIRLVAEYRVAFDGGANGPAAGVIAGTGPAPLAMGFDLETYGQAGVVRRHRAEPFAEGAARLSRRMFAIGGAKVDLGLGGWGGAQRGAQRLDVGPSLGVRIPVAGKAIRASLDCGIM